MTDNSWLTNLHLPGSSAQLFCIAAILNLFPHHLSNSLLLSSVQFSPGSQERLDKPMEALPIIMLVGQFGMEDPAAWAAFLHVAITKS